LFVVVGRERIRAGTSLDDAIRTRLGNQGRAGRNLMPVITVNGVALNYRELGNREGRTIVLAHSIPFGAQVFDEVATELADTFHLVIPDIHGHGESGYRAPLTLEEMAADFRGLLDALELSRVAWVGYSIGGLLGMRLALEHPETLDSLVVIAATARPDEPQLREQALRLWELFRDGHREEVAGPAMGAFFAPATFRDQPRLVERFREKLIHLEGADGIFEAVRAVFDRTDISGRIGAIEAPTLVIGAKDDMAVPPEESEWIASHIPNARLAMIEDTSHLVAVERPREVARLIREFLER
jgi:3-oxoadipate enol-lactonase